MNSIVSVSFNESIASLTVNSNTFSVASGDSPISGNATINTDGKSATFQPSSSLPGLSIISVRLSGIKDLAGNPISEMNWSFETASPPDTVAPLITRVLPAESPGNIGVGTRVTVQFSEAMDTSTITGNTFTVASGATVISGTFSFSADGKMATFTPSAPLASDSVITVTLTTGIKDLSGNAMAANKEWTFQTVTAFSANLLITEVSSSEYTNSFRWVEVYNTTRASIDLGNYKLRALSVPRSSGASPVTALFNIPSLSVPANSYAVIRVKGTDTDIFDGPNLVHILGAGTTVPYWVGNGFIELIDGANHTVDFIRWGTDNTTPQTPDKWVSGAAPALPSTLGSSNLHEIKAARLPLPKKNFFYYCIFGDQQPTGNWGLGELDGNDFLVSLGHQNFLQSTASDLTYLSNIMATAFMHEFGHNLGLQHGGNESLNYKPNYLSIMNYLYSGWGVPQVGNAREGDRYYHT